MTYMDGDLALTDSAGWSRAENLNASSMYRIGTLVPNVCLSIAYTSRIDVRLSHSLRAAYLGGQKGTHIWVDGFWRQNGSLV